jgi:Spy/CpxP family protein refolding chaperone
MNRSLKFLAALSLSALVFAAPTFAEGDAGGAKKEGGDRKGAVEGGAKKEGGQRGGAAAERLQGLADKLNLTADQKAQAAPIIQETREAVQKINADTTGDPKEKRAKVMEAVKAGQDKLLAILTPEQKAELEKAKADGAGKRGPKDGEGAKKGGGDTGAKKNGGDKN